VPPANHAHGIAYSAVRRSALSSKAGNVDVTARPHAVDGWEPWCGRCASHLQLIAIAERRLMGWLVCCRS